MKRSEFLQQLALMGIGTAILPPLLTSCDKEDENQLVDVNFNGNVLIIGAGSAGMMAGWTLQQHGADFQILEASSVFGGRVKKVEGLVDFPIDTGGEWIHTDPGVFSRMLKDDDIQGEIDLITYQPKSIRAWNNGKLRKHNWASHFYSEYKFKSTTWFDFFDQFVVPAIADKITYNSPVSAIDYSGSKVQVTNTSGEVFEADKVIITVPLTVLQDNDISFTPALPAAKTTALQDAIMPDGLKVFIRFKERFYPDLVGVGPLTGSGSSSHLYYDAAFGKDTNDNLLGLFVVDDYASTYTDLGTDEAIFNFVMNELDTIFDGQATQHYMDHVVQNWSGEPYIRGSYSHFDDSDLQNTLRETVSNTLYFAGEAYSEEAQSTIHGAGLSGRLAAETILKG